jgi:hypothetical protein
MTEYKYLVTLAPASTPAANTDQIWRNTEEQAKEAAFAALATGKYDYLTITQCNMSNKAAPGRKLLHWSTIDGLKVDRRSQIWDGKNLIEAPPMKAHGAYL